jgi:hypothetical protein
MAQIFHPATNTISKVSIGALLLFLGGLGWAGPAFYRSSFITDAFVARDQPVPFSHKHHVGEIGIDCRYCHTSVEESSFAGIPPTRTCITCHSQIFAQAPMLEPVRSSWRTGTSLSWTRVHDLPDFVYFDHSIHVAKGVACATCHGRVDRMPITWKTATLHMEWCLSCHRNPERYVGRMADRFRPDARPVGEAEGRELVRERGIESLTDCWTCHR